MANSIEQITNYFIKQDLSDEDIKSITGKEPYTYEELGQFNTLEDLLGAEGFAVILYQTTKTSGHWTAIIENKNLNKIIFFDSYGFMYDREIQFTKYNQSLPTYLTMLIEKSDRDVIFNQYDYQKWSKSVSTCGRWASIAVKFLKHISLSEFQQLFTTNKNSLINQPDFTSTLMTLLILKDIPKYFNK